MTQEEFATAAESEFSAMMGTLQNSYKQSHHQKKEASVGSPLSFLGIGKKPGIYFVMIIIVTIIIITG